MDFYTNFYAFETKESAEAILNAMNELADNYGIVLASDVYDMLNLPAPYMSNKYSWIENTVKQARVVSTDNGYVIESKRAVAIE